MSKQNRNRLLLVLAFVLALLVLPLWASAQDEVPTAEEFPTATVVDEPTAEPTIEATAVPTEEPEPPPIETPVIVDQTGFRVGLFGFIASLALLFIGGAGVGATWANIRNSKQAKDDLEMAYESTSPKTQDDIRNAWERAGNAWDRVDQLAREVLKFVGEVTDKQPNLPPPPPPESFSAHG